jgi:hypothetical protein
MAGRNIRAGRFLIRSNLSVHRVSPRPRFNGSFFVVGGNEAGRHQSKLINIVRNRPGSRKLLPKTSIRGPLDSLTLD